MTDYIIHCPTRTLFDQVMKRLNAHGLKFRDADVFDSYSEFCIWVEKRVPAISYSSRAYVVESRGMRNKIINASVWLLGPEYPMPEQETEMMLL